MSQPMTGPGASVYVTILTSCRVSFSVEKLHLSVPSTRSFVWSSLFQLRLLSFSVPLEFLGHESFSIGQGDVPFSFLFSLFGVCLLVFLFSASCIWLFTSTPLLHLSVYWSWWGNDGTCMNNSSSSGFNVNVHTHTMYKCVFSVCQHRKSEGKLFSVCSAISV